jgi:hypothetical protein
MGTAMDTCIAAGAGIITAGAEAAGIIMAGGTTVITRAFSVPTESERGSIFCFDAFSSREPVSTPHQVRGRLSLENAMVASVFANHCPGESECIV